MQDWHRSRSFVEALSFAWSGMKSGFWRERNIRRQITICAVVLILGLLVRLSNGELALLVLSSGLVISLEFINTALELIEDIVWPEYRDAIKRSKDTAAAAVFVASMAAAAVGALLLLPPLAKLLLLLY